MWVARIGKLAVACLLLTGLVTCDRRHDSKDFSPAAPAISQAIQILLAAASIPADGVSTVRVEARIDAGADADKRTIRFETSLGEFVTEGGSTASDKPLQLPADAQGRAVAFLRSAKKAGVAVITVSVIGTADSREVVLASVTAEVEFVEVTEAISLLVSPPSNFADGVSPVVLEARISEASPPAWNMVIFETSLGIFDNETDPAKQKKKTVPTDSQRIARVLLTSSQVGTAAVTATIDAFKSASVSALVPFDLRNPDAVKIGVSRGKVPADGASQISVFADIADGLASRNVTFTTTGGAFIGAAAGTPQTIVAAADASNRATVRLRADRTIASVLLTATVDLDNATPRTQQSDTRLIDFIRALPDFIQLSADPSSPTAADKRTTITATLTRNVGKVSENTVVDYAVLRNSDGTVISDMEFENVTRTNSDGVSTADLVFETSAEPLPVVVRVRAEVDGAPGATEELSFTISP